MVQQAVMAFMVIDGVTFIRDSMRVNAFVRRDVFFSYLIFGLATAFLGDYRFQL